MDASSLIAEWKGRLVALAENPPYAFRDTQQDLIEAHQRRLTTFTGYAEASVARVEEALGSPLPEVFRTFLLEMGASRGDLFCGSDLVSIPKSGAAHREFSQFRKSAVKLMRETEGAASLPERAIVWLWHQGYTFCYFEPGDPLDVPQMQWSEGDAAPRRRTSSFAKLVDGELSQMEANARAFRERGGYYLTLMPGGGGRQEFPALNSGDRPLDRMKPSTFG